MACIASTVAAALAVITFLNCKGRLLFKAPFLRVIGDKVNQASLAKPCWLRVNQANFSFRS